MNNIPQISFIIIGRNEGKKIEASCRSVHEACSSEGITGYETIFVDSNSTDNSIEIAQRSGFDKIFRIENASGAAIARNEGARNANGRILFFLDGDMELVPGFITKIFDTEGRMIHPFVSASWENYYYSPEGEFLYHELYRKMAVSKPTYQTITGGFFVMERELWEKLNGMDTRFLTGQDLDLGLRSSISGSKLLRLPDVAVKHHTVNYRNETRKWKSLMAFRDVYARALLYRKHFWRNKYVYRRMATSDPTWLFLCFTIVVALVTMSLWPLAAYPPVVLAATLLHRKKENLSIFMSELAFIFTRDIFNLAAFLFFHPDRPVYSVKTIKTGE